MSGGKGGTKTSTVEIPEYIERAAQRNLNRAEQIAQMGYVPYYGPDVAAFTPMQEAAMQNVASAAGAFGLATPTGASVTGMPTATEYAGGIRGYSSAPMFEQAQAELAARRPAQKSYIDSFFIDPVTGAYGANAPALVDYTQFGTAADERAAQRANELAMAEIDAAARVAGSALSRPEYNTYTNIIQETIGDPNYNPATDVLTAEQQAAISSDPEAQLAQDAIYMNVLGNQANTFGDDLKAIFGSGATFDDPSSSGSFGGSLVTGGLSGDLTGIPGVAGNIVDSVLADVNFEKAVELQGKKKAEAAGSTKKDDGSFDISSWFKDTSATPTITPKPKKKKKKEKSAAQKAMEKAKQKKAIEKGQKAGKGYVGGYGF